MRNQIRIILLAMLLGALAFGGCKSEKSSFDPLGLLALSGGTTYTVTYDGNGALHGNVPAGPVNYTQNAMVTVLGNIGNLRQPYYVFNGWNTAANGSGDPYTSGGTFTMSKVNVTLYAQWTSGYDYYVNTTGSDTLNDGKTPSTAFKTITHAVATAETYCTVKAAPGMYTIANGETFPITLKEGQYLIGDVANKGQGTTTTEIKCTNSTAGVVSSENSCAILANNTTVKGFIFGNTMAQNFVSGIYSGAGLNVVVSDNSFDNMLYCGIYFHSGNLTSENNDFYNFSYSYYLDSVSTSIVLINNNIVRMYSTIPINIIGGNSNTVISNNTITGSGQTGVQVMGGNPIIQNNTFNNAGGYTYGAVHCISGNPKIRGNTFICTGAILLDGSAANPDIGMSSDSGNNIFTSVTGYAIKVEATVTVTNIYALGNTWPGSHNPPTTSDIVNNTASTKVWYGTGVSEYR
jgi:uncharacterized repeat protein (TIGR02543 family)